MEKSFFGQYVWGGMCKIIFLLDGKIVSSGCKFPFQLLGKICTIISRI